ncbi:glucosyltransferase domain-containing protein [Jeotgalibacillus terrae]|uniref:Glucosyltransferase domain-containing protein n=1 Tax=Jeotgalibacillus terrae TaxID=587735 RepID=A0ABW5ZDI5_9BACL|nr:glucosyltransferase domain-containing protein [Jeotgalibacillus terrae]MBM7577797.1 hypothetical protein [Jeotgalibacillus terrae]
MPEDLFKWVKSKMKREWKTSFIAALIIGFLTHMFVMTNTLPNHDGLINVYNTQEKYVSGRFFLSPLAGISSYFDLPWLNGALSMLYLALTALFVTMLLDIKKTLSVILTAGMIVTFPTVTATLSYMFTADGYMLANLLTVISLVIAKKWRFGFIPASLLFYISVGTYQANLTILLTFAGIYLIKELLNHKSTVKHFFEYLLRFSGVAVLGMGLYFIHFKIYQAFFAGQVTSYQGLDEVGSGGVGVTSSLRKIYDSGMEFFFNGLVTGSTPQLYEYLNIAFFVILACGLLTGILSNKIYRHPMKLILLALSLFALPFLVYLLYFVSPGVTYHMLMVMAIAAVYILPVVIYDQLSITHRPAVLVRAYSWISVLLISVIIFNYAVIANISYFNMDLRYEKSYATMNRVLDRMEQTENYEDVSQLAVIGVPDIRSRMGIRIWDTIPEITGAMSDSFIGYPVHVQYMLGTYFGENFYLLRHDALDAYTELPEVKNMPVWPEEGSITVIDETMIIKFREE